MLTQIDSPVTDKRERFALRMLGSIELYAESWRTMRTGRALDIIFGLRMLGVGGGRAN